MQLYSTPTIKDYFIKQNHSAPNRKDIAHFFTLQKMFDVLGVQSVYTDDLSSAVFIDNSELSKLALLASCKFGKEFKYKKTEQEDNLFLKFKEYDKNRHTRHEVSSFENLVDILKEHNLSSTYSIAQNIKRAKEKKIKQSLFHDMSNMDRDFFNSKIVSVDFEYNPNTQFKNHIDTVFEFGISIYEKGQIEYYHYLIQENYPNKKTNHDLQYKFNFGESIIVKMNEVKSVFQKHMENANYLLFHEYSADYNIMKHNGMGVEGKNIELLDTQMFFRKHFQKELNEANPLSLRRLLTTFNLEGSNLHNSGNDAAYTLQTFLKMKESYDLKNKIEENINNISKKHKKSNSLNF